MKSMKVESRMTGKNGNITVNLPVLLFKEDNTHIIYCPALDLNGSGNTVSEAKESFIIVVTEYLKYTSNKGSLWNDLKKLGWTIQKNKKRPATPPSMSELLESNDEFSRIFDNYPYKKFDAGFSLPAYV